MFITDSGLPDAVLEAYREANVNVIRGGCLEGSGILGAMERLIIMCKNVIPKNQMRTLCLLCCFVYFVSYIGLLGGVPIVSILLAIVLHGMLKDGITMLPAYDSYPAICVVMMIIITGCMYGINLMLISRVPGHFAGRGNVSTASQILVI